MPFHTKCVKIMLDACFLPKIILQFFKNNNSEAKLVGYKQAVLQ